MTISEKGTPAVIRTKGLTKKYGELTAVDHLDLTVFKGEVFGLLGPNGAGKTTTTLMLLGLTEPDSGEAIIKDLNCTRDSIEVKKAVGYLPDNVGFYSGMTGGRISALPAGSTDWKEMRWRRKSTSSLSVSIWQKPLIKKQAPIPGE